MGKRSAPERASDSRTSREPGAPGAERRAIAGGAPPEFDRLIHERMRLGIVSALAVNDSLSFRELKDLLETSDGNLSVHARKLEEAGYVRCTKAFSGRVPQTRYQLSEIGRRALEQYLRHMEALIGAMRRG